MTEEDLISLYTLTGILLVLYFIVGTPLNAMCLFYFLSKTDKSVTKLQYAAIAITDLASLLVAFLIAVNMFLADGWLFRDNNAFCTTVFFVWMVTTRMSVFLVVLLSVSRSISLVFPFRKISFYTILFSIVVYLVILINEAGFPFYFNAKFHYSEKYRYCGWDPADPVIGLSTEAATVVRTIFTFGMFSLPALPVAMSTAVSVWILYRQNRFTQSQTKCAQILTLKRRYSAVTVLMLTEIYIVCNIILWVNNISEIYSSTTKGTIQQHWSLSEYNLVAFKYAVNFHSVLLNTVLNCFIYLNRIKSLQTYARQLILLPRNAVICFRSKVYRQNGNGRRRKITFLSNGVTF